MAPINTAQLLDRYFGFLVRDFGFSTQPLLRRRDIAERRYRRDPIGVIVAIDLQETFTFVQVCRLVDGSFARAIGEIRPDTVLNCFDLNDLVELHDPSKVVRGYYPERPEPEGGLEGITKRQAENLRDIGGAVLSGDFSEFATLESKVKARAKRFAIEKWGPRAKEFGWDVP
jgi:hypothetical protein